MPPVGDFGEPCPRRCDEEPPLPRPREEGEPVLPSPREDGEPALPLGSRWCRGVTGTNDGLANPRLRPPGVEPV
jgi:hypothetical protein